MNKKDLSYSKFKEFCHQKQSLGAYMSDQTFEMWVESGGTECFTRSDHNRKREKEEKERKTRGEKRRKHYR